MRVCVGHRHDTDTYNYIELCHFLKIIIGVDVSVFVSVSVLHIRCVSGSNTHQSPTSTHLTILKYVIFKLLLVLTFLCRVRFLGWMFHRQ
jgi:hypothetical protein